MRYIEKVDIDRKSRRSIKEGEETKCGQLWCRRWAMASQFCALKCCSTRE